jgi:polyisoprenoid-binding protein YceI
MTIRATNITAKLAAAICLFVACSVFGQTSVRYKAAPGSKVSIDGTSTVHDWTVEGKMIAGSMEWDAAYPLDPANTSFPEIKKMPKVEVKIPVTFLKSTKKSKLMDKIMYTAMRIDKAKFIEYKLKSLKVKKTERKAGDPIVFDSEGDLIVAGTKKTIKMPVTFTWIKGGIIKISGATKVKMTDYGIEPPAPKVAAGMIKTGDEVALKFEWLTKKVAAK